MSEHEKHVCQVLQHLVENCLYVKGEKCVFHIQSVSFLGLVVEKGHLWGDPGLWLPEPLNGEQLQRFLGFANFYWLFIGDFSEFPFSSAPLLIRLLTCWNIALPQHSSRFRWPLQATHREVDVKLYPCAFFSHCLSKAERNYDMELFVIRQEGKAHTLVIWMDHKNLVYRQIAKWLNAHQVRLHRFYWRFFQGCSFCRSH